MWFRHHIKLVGLWDGATVEHRKEQCPFPSPKGPRHRIPMEMGTLPAAAEGDPFCQHGDHPVKVRLGKLPKGIGSAQQGKQIILGNRMAFAALNGADGADLLGQYVQGDFGHR